MGEFSGLEVAVGAWMLALAGVSFACKKTRPSALKLVRTLVHPTLSLRILLLGGYTSAVAWGLYEAGFWSSAFLKETVIWFLFSGVVLAFDLIAARPAKPLLATVAKHQIGMVIIVQFLVHTYSFGVLPWLLLVPVIALLGAVEGFAEHSPAHRSVARLARWLQCLCGLTVFVAVVNGVVQNFAELLSIDMVKSLMVAPILALLFLPALYVLLLVSFYEETFALLNAPARKSRDLGRYAKWRIFRFFGLNLAKTRKVGVATRVGLISAKTRQDVEAALHQVNDSDFMDNRAA